MVEISEFFSESSQTSVLQDPMVTCVEKCFFSKFGTCTKNGSFGVDGENIVKELKGGSIYKQYI